MLFPLMSKVTRKLTRRALISAKHLQGADVFLLRRNTGKIYRALALCSPRGRPSAHIAVIHSRAQGSGAGAA